LNLKELNDKQKKCVTNHWKKEKKIDQQISDLEAKKGRMRYLYKTKHFKPILDLVKEKLGANFWEEYGPFGLCSETTYYFVKELGDICKRGNVLGSICIVSGDGWMLRDEKKNTGKYPKNSLGEVNGMNNPRIEFTEKMDVDWLVKWAKRQR